LAPEQERTEKLEKQELKAYGDNYFGSSCQKLKIGSSRRKRAPKSTSKHKSNGSPSKTVPQNKTTLGIHKAEINSQTSSRVSIDMQASVASQQTRRSLGESSSTGALPVKKCSKHKKIDSSAQLEALNRLSSLEIAAPGGALSRISSRDSVDLSPVSAALPMRDINVSPISFQHSRQSPFVRVPSRE
jgi:hypothetical protein